MYFLIISWQVVYSFVNCARLKFLLFVHMETNPTMYGKRLGRAAAAVEQCYVLFANATHILTCQSVSLSVRLKFGSSIYLNELKGKSIL